ncbi:MAG: galactokinase [Leptospiraceae bacterium]|nr:galactokinase [Leptospiraceae bacterium]
MVAPEKIHSAFAARFGSGGRFYCAPGRVNLIGEHTDYNLGFVLPGAIDKAITLEIRPNNSNAYRVYSLDYDDEVRFAAGEAKLPQAWANYVLGVVMEFHSRCFGVPGFDAVFAGDVPLGGGLSSSAALESAFAFAINDLFNYGLGKLELAQIGQSAEHKYAGVRCGIMDQFASLHGEQGKLIQLDCRSLEHEMIPFAPADWRVVLIDTHVKHSLASSEYNQRREQCEAGVKALQKRHTHVKSLRDADLPMLEESRREMGETVFSRCRYVVEENIRLLRGVGLLKAGDFTAFGKEMFASHAGLRHLYAVSCDELDHLVDTAAQLPGTAGARMMGGGFGGCTINLVSEAARETVIARCSESFEKKFGHKPLVYDVVISDGARRLS